MGWGGRWDGRGRWLGGGNCIFSLASAPPRSRIDGKEESFPFRGSGSAGRTFSYLIPLGILNPFLQVSGTPLPEESMPVYRV